MLALPLRELWPHPEGISGRLPLRVMLSGRVVLDLITARLPKPVWSVARSPQSSGWEQAPALPCPKPCQRLESWRSALCIVHLQMRFRVICRIFNDVRSHQATIAMCVLNLAAAHSPGWLAATCTTSCEQLYPATEATLLGAL